MHCDTFCFCFNASATTEIYTLSLHDALPILHRHRADVQRDAAFGDVLARHDHALGVGGDQQVRRVAVVGRSEEHTSELQSHVNLVCRLLLEKKKNSSSDMNSQRNSS